MDKKKHQYTPFGPKARSFVGGDRIWFGRDHVLLVTSTGISETYKRFFFKDIQAVQILKTHSHRIKWFLLGVVFLAAVTAGVWSGISAATIYSPGLIISAAIALVMLCMLLWQFSKGPSCQCFIYSSVQKEKLRPLKTLKTANRFLKKLIPEVETVQGEMALPEIPGEVMVCEAMETGPARGIIAQPLPCRISRKWHAALFLTLIGLSAVGTAILLSPHPILFLAWIIIFSIAFVFNIAAVIKQIDTRMRTSIKGIVISTTILMVLCATAGYGEFFFIILQNAEEWAATAQNQYEMYKMISQFDLFEYPVLLVINLFFIAAFAVSGLFGLGLLWRQKG